MRCLAAVPVVATLLVLATNHPAAALYTPLRFFQLAGTAELIVAGEIVEVREETFVLRISDVLYGEPKQLKIEVRQFHDWGCAWRWESYLIGQKVLLFLNLHDGQLVIPGGGGEGESPIVGKDVLCNFMVDMTEDEFDDLEKYGQGHFFRVSYDQLRDAIVNYRKAFSLPRICRTTRPITRQMLGADRVAVLWSKREIDHYAQRSRLHAELVKTTLAERDRLKKIAGER